MRSDLTGSSKWRWWLPNRNYKTDTQISKLVDKIGTTFQPLNLCFRGPAIQWLWCCSTKPKVKNRNTYILTSWRDIDEIPTATPMFSGSNYQMAIARSLHDQTANINSKMATVTTEIFISQLVDMIARRFQRLAICSNDGQVNEADTNHVLVNRK